MITDETKFQIERMYVIGLGVRAIARELGIHHSTVANHLGLPESFTGQYRTGGPNGLKCATCGGVGASLVSETPKPDYLNISLRNFALGYNPTGNLINQKGMPYVVIPFDCEKGHNSVFILSWEDVPQWGIFEWDEDLWGLLPEGQSWTEDDLDEFANTVHAFLDSNKG